MNGLQAQLEQSRLQEAELLGALKEMQDKVLDLEKVRICVRVSHSITPYIVFFSACTDVCLFLCIEEQLSA